MSPSRSSVTSVDSLSRHCSFNQYDFASLRRGGQKNGFSSASSCNGGDSYMASSERPNSALSSSVQQTFNNKQPPQEVQRPHTISSSFERGGHYNMPLLNGQ